MAMTYMQRRKSGIYELRKRMPLSLAGKPAPDRVKLAHPDLVNPKTGCFKLEVVRSLGTTDHAKARKADLRAAHKVIEMIEAAERLMASPEAIPAATISPALLDELAAETKAQLLRQDEAQRSSVDYRREEQTREERAALGPDLLQVHDGTPWGMQRDHFEVYGGLLAEEIEAHRAALARRDISIIRGDLETALRRHRVPIDRSSTGYRDAGLAVLRGTLEAHEMMARRQSGEDVPTPQAAPVQRGPKLSEAHFAWRQGGGLAGSRQPGRRAIAEAEPAVRYFIELHGDMRLGDITKQHARSYREVLVRIPKRLPAKLRKLSLAKLQARDLGAFETRDPATINKMLTMVAAIVSNAKRGGGLDHVPGYVNPFDRDIKLVIDQREKEDRAVFTRSELDHLFGTAIFTRGKRPRAGGGEAAFWFPIIGLTSGLRLDEIAGLRLRDLHEDPEAGCWVLDVRHHAGRGIKTPSSIRKVPVHPAVLAIGLADYRAAVIGRGAGPDDSLWPAVKSAPNRTLSASWSQWFGRFLRKEAGITDPRKVFHSFRHTFKQMARDAGVPEELHDALTGHVGGGVGRGYGGVSLKKLAEAIGKLEVPEAVKGLRWSGAS